MDVLTCLLSDDSKRPSQREEEVTGCKDGKGLSEASDVSVTWERAERRARKAGYTVGARRDAHAPNAAGLVLFDWPGNRKAAAGSREAAAPRTKMTRQKEMMHASHLTSNTTGRQNTRGEIRVDVRRRLGMQEEKACRVEQRSKADRAQSLRQE
eukprot:6092352-Pleurochrysis_carterae.AAC.1